ncbi:MAG: alpha/beta hydrolase [Roseovarius sp.]|nr:alpha/beta hydrolase [Roseovarius sp.]
MPKSESIKPHRPFIDMSLAKRVSLLAVWVIMLLALVAMAALTFQSLRNKRFVEALTLPGQMITLEGGNIYLNCQGDKQDPTLIFENGMGLASENWDWVQRALSSEYYACTYDRASIGFSDSFAGPVGAGHSADVLSQLLDKIGITEPVLIVGHSYGALIARVFADRFPERVAGLVLVDSSHEDMADRFPAEAQEGFKDMLAGFSILSIANHFGGAQLLGVPDMFANGLEGDAKARADHLYGSVSHMVGSAAEASEWEQSAVLARGVAERQLGDLPLSVVMVDGWPDVMMPSWTAMQQGLAALSSTGTFTVVETADHFEILTKEMFASQIADTVRSLAVEVF